jgi:hypothetical protein
VSTAPTTCTPLGEAESQPIRALELANAARLWRAGVKDVLAALPQRESKAGVAGLLVRRVPARRKDYLASVPVFELLDWIYHWPSKRNAALLDRAGIASEMRTVGELTERQRHALAEALTDAERAG